MFTTFNLLPPFQKRIYKAQKENETTNNADIHDNLYYDVKYRH